jgi:hypothetical protein
VIAALPSFYANSGPKILMTDAPAPDQTPQAQAPAAPMIRVLAQYVKDLSFENPGLFASQQANTAPEIELGIDVKVEPGPPQEAIFAVELRLSARAKRQETVVFIAELVYAGVFQLQAAPALPVRPPHHCGHHTRRRPSASDDRPDRLRQPLSPAARPRRGRSAEARRLTFSKSGPSSARRRGVR